MSFKIDRAEMDSRMREVRAVLSLIRTLEDSAVPPVDSEEVKTLRGLFFVHLYGSFEKSINEAFEAYISAVSLLSVTNLHLDLRVWPSAFDSIFRSLQAVSGGTWKSRSKLVGAGLSGDKCKLVDGLFSEHLQNVWTDTIVTAVDYLGLPPVPWTGRETLYLDEVVDKRNQVAHGRTSPVKVGSSGRSDDLALRLSALEALLDGLVDHLEQQMIELPFVKAEYRATYAA